VGLGGIVVQNHDATTPKSLSELAAAEVALLRRFRNILLFCGTLFAITVFGFVVPHIEHPVATAIFGALMIGGELLLAVISARGKTFLLHLMLAYTMAVGMLGLAVTFVFALTGTPAIIAVCVAGGMGAFAALTWIDKKHYILHELAFIFLSHFSIIVAALALR